MPSQPDSQQLVYFEQHNETTLHFLTGLAETTPEPWDDTLESRELARLELKIDLLIHLMAELLTEQGKFPPQHQVRLSDQWLEWEESDNLVHGDRVQAEVYMDHRWPRPLLFWGYLADCELGRDIDCKRLIFQDLTEVVQDGLTRLIFRHHRRSIALERRRMVPRA